MLVRKRCRIYPGVTLQNENAIYDNDGNIADAISLQQAYSACMNVKAV